MMNLATTMDDDNHEVPVAVRGYLHPAAGEDSLPLVSEPSSTVAASPQLRGSGSYPAIIRARTANRNKISKRTSDSSMIITGGHHLHYHHGHHGIGGGGISSAGGCIMLASSLVPDGSLNARSVATSKKRKLLNNKRSVYSKASRRKSLENLGLLVRNRCGTAKLQWPSEKKESDVFDLLPEGCLQVRQLIRLKSRGSGGGGGDGNYNCGSSGFVDFNNGGGSEKSKGGHREIQHNTKKDNDDDDDDSCLLENGVPGSTELNTVNTKDSTRLKFQGRQQHEEDNSCIDSAYKTDWKSRRNISVIVRIRPKHDKERREKSIVFRTDSKTIVFDPKEKTKDFYFQGVKQLTRTDFGRKRPNRNVSFQFDKVFGPEATNREIFDDMLKDLTEHLIEGFSVSVLAYGATGAGKTYTMIGSNSNAGLTVLMVESLYKRLEDLAEEYECEVVCSYLEVYNETIKDLLRPEKELSIREDGKKGLIISELSFYKPRGPQELLKLLRSGNRARTQHATDLNAESSRSHAVFEVKLCLKRKRNERCQQKGSGGGGNKKYHEQGENMKNGEENDNVLGTCIGDVGRNNNDDDGGKRDEINKVEVIKSKLVMVDLAGSERGTAATFHNNPGGTGIFVDGGVRQREGASINKSLLALASCISALADGKCHVPYRNSKLTRLLKDSLNGLCTTVMIANISPSALTSEDTYNTLKYADRAKSIVGPVAKQKNVFMEDLIGEDCAKTQMLELQVKNVQLQEQLEEEKLKRELILKELEELQRRNVEEKTEPGQEDRNALEKAQMKEKGNRRKSIMTGDSTEDNPPSEHRCDVDYGVETNDDDDKDKRFPRKNVSSEVVTEDQLPSEIQQYIEIFEERARILSEYVEFSSQTRFNEWGISCKKLKTDTADFLGRLPVEDENYIWFSQLKNEVNNNNNNSGTFCGGSATVLDTAASTNHEYYQSHEKYALKVKNLTEKLERVRRNCVKHNLLPDTITVYDAPHGSTEKLRSSQKLVAIPMEEYLELKQLASEHEGKEKVNQFYQQFCRQINNQLMTSGTTLINALKMVKSTYLQLRNMEESTSSGCEAVGKEALCVLSPSSQQEYKELLGLIYGPGPPPKTTTVVPRNAHQDQRMATAYNNKNISSNVNTDSLLPSLSATERPSLSPTAPQIPPQLSNFGRKSSLIIDDLANMRKLVERPLLIQLTSALGAEEDTEIKEPLTALKGEDKNLADLRATEEQLWRSNSSFPCFVTTANFPTRKSLSTTRTIYEPPQPTPVTRVGGESSPESQLPSHGWQRAATAISCLEEQDEEETCYNDEDDNDVEDNDHHYIHTAPAIADNDDDSTSFLADEPFQVETSPAVTANESCSKKGMWNSSSRTTTNNIGGHHRCNLLNPASRKNSTSFEIIFDKKEEKRAGGIGKSGNGKVARRCNEKSSTPFGPSVLSALSRQKISEKHLDNGNESLNEDWTTVTSSSSGSGTTTATTSSPSTSAEMVMKVKSKCVSSSDDVGEGRAGSVQQKNPIGNRERLVDQALIKDYQKNPYHHLCPQIKEKTTPSLRTGQMQEKNDNRNCQEDGEVKEGMEQGNPSSYIYQLGCSPWHASVDVSGGSGEDGGNKRGFATADGNGSEMYKTTGRVKSCLFTQRSKTEQEKKLSVSTTAIVRGTTTSMALQKRNTSFTNVHIPNPNPLRHRGHLKQQQQEAPANKLVGATETKPDIGCSRKNNNSRPRQQHHLQQPHSRNSNTGGGGERKGLNPLLPLAAAADVVTFTTPPEFSMNIQGQMKNQPHQQRQHHYKVAPVKKSIALHSSKESADLRSRESENVIDTHRDGLAQKKINYHYYPSVQQEPLEENVGMMMGSGDDESEYTESECKERSLLSSARSTLSHQQKAPYHTNCKTFTISRELLPTANMPVIHTLPPSHMVNTLGYSSRNVTLSPNKSTARNHQFYQHQHRGNIETTNYHSSNEETDDGNDNDNYEKNSEKYTTSADDRELDDGDDASCYSADDCN